MHLFHHIQVCLTKIILEKPTNKTEKEQTFRMLAIFAPPLPITLPTALAGTNISRVEGGGKLHKCRKSICMDSIYVKENKILGFQEHNVLTLHTA